MGVQTLHGEGPHRLLWAVSRAARGKITLVVPLTKGKECIVNHNNELKFIKLHVSAHPWKRHHQAVRHKRKIIYA